MYLNLKFWVLTLTIVFINLNGVFCESALKSTKAECNLPQEVINDISGYADVTNRILEYILNGPYKRRTWNSLAQFVDKFGHRLSGSKDLEDSIDYMVNLSKTSGLENVHTEEVEVPHWVRGVESATLLEPRLMKLPMLGLGLSVGTSPDGITAEAVVVQSFDELKALPADKVMGKIVVYDEPYTTYGETVQYRGSGATEAAKKGAIAALVRSVTPFSLGTPHTGVQQYAGNVTRIPVAAISLEDADLLWRLYQRGEKIVIKLLMSATLDYKISRNAVAELTGAEIPDKVVVVSGHIDSWDVGDGAMDDGGGIFISWVAPVILKELNLRPRRTLRTILFTAEELGLIGARAYEEAHKNENDNLNFVMESDFGTFTPLGLNYLGNENGECYMREVLKLFGSINATQINVGDAGPDVSFWTDKGIPGGGLFNDNGKYFWYHHSAGDTINVVDPDVLDRDAAFWTAFSYIVADMKFPVPRS